MKSKKQLLSTAILDQPLINKAEEKGVGVDCMSFIQADVITDRNVLAEVKELSSLRVTAVFTSANAINAIAGILHGAKPAWEIYCIGTATKNALLEHFDAAAIKGSANDAAALAMIILESDVNEVVFFCGDKRMNILPEILQGNQILVHELVVYETTAVLQVITKEYDGILFFSPSSVNSFFSINKISPDTVLFAIGNTTAAAISAQTGNKIIVSEAPSKKMLVEQAVQYFHQQALAHIGN